MSMKLNFRKYYSVKGFTLIEVMISLVILAVGMLGMTAMQNESLKYNHAAFIDSQAQFLLADMAERIRANSGNNTYAILFTETTPTASTNCASTTCTSNQMATWDINQWRRKIESNVYLPSGESQILFDNITRTFVISVRYDWTQLGGVDINDGKRTVSFTTRIGG